MMEMVKDEESDVILPNRSMGIMNAATSSPIVGWVTMAIDNPIPPIAINIIVIDKDPDATAIIGPAHKPIATANIFRCAIMTD